MTLSSEIGHSRSANDKAEARLTYQREAVRGLGFDVDPSFASTANETLALIKARLVRLRADRASLLEEREQSAPTAATIRAAART